jgi:hypothetical protein
MDCISEPTAFPDNRSMWCQTFDLTSPEERREIMYPTIRKLLGTMIRHSGKKEFNVQKEAAQSGNKS